METNINPLPHKSLIRVLWRKFVEVVDAHSFRDMAKFIILSFVAGLFSSAALDGGKLIQSIAEWRNGAVPTIILSIIFVFSFPWFYRTLREAFITTCDNIDRRRSERAAGAYSEAGDYEEGDTIEGMDTEAVIDHLLKKRTFKRDDIESQFQIPRYRYSALVKKMKEIGVLVGGENNMSVLSEEWNREKLRALFAGKEVAADLEKQVNIVRIPSPTPLFKRRAISCATLEETASASHVQPSVQPDMQLVAA